MHVSSKSDRSQRLVERLEQRGLDLLLVTDIVNVRYLTGFTGTSGLCLVGREDLRFFTDFRYREQAGSEVGGFDVVIGGRDLYETLAGLLESMEKVSIGFDNEHLSVRRYLGLLESLPESTELIDAGGAVEELRAVKEDGELEAIGKATELADEVYVSVIEKGIIGRSEREVAWELERGMREAGAEAVSFPPIVASGQNGALPHAQAGNDTIDSDSFVVIDWGCTVGGYSSDCTRTVVTGDSSDEMKSVYKLVLDAQKSAVHEVSDGVEASKVDSRARTIIGKGGYAEMFGHGTGHGVGLEVHEAPRISQKSDAILLAGNVITIEPGIYLPGNFGVRIEDLVVVKDDGCEVLTGIDKEFQVVS